MSTFAVTVTIASGGTSSTVAPANDAVLVGIITPSSMTGTTLSLYGGYSSGSLLPMYDEDGAPLSVVVTTSAYIATGWTTAYAPYLKLVSDASGGEGAERTLTLVFRTSSGSG